MTRERNEPRSLVPTGFFALRTPLLPFSELSDLSAGLAAGGADPAALPAALAADRALLSARLREAAARPEVREAIFLASPSLDERLPAWLAGAEDRDGKMERVLYRYFARMSARPTPFGLFAGSGVGTIGGSTRLLLCARGEARKHSRLDMDFLFALAEAVARSPELRDDLVFRPNPSLFRAPERVRFMEAKLDGRARTYHLVSVEPTDYLEATLSRAAEGARLDALAEALVDGEISRDEAMAYVVELCESRILVPDLGPAVTGPEPAATLAAELAGHAAGAPLAASLAAAGEALARIDAAGLGVPPERYRAVALGLAGLPAAPDLSRLFQVDLVKPTDGATLGPEVVREIGRAVDLLHRLAPAPDWLGAFTEAFVARYGDQEVPLLEALDEETGLAFGGAGGGAFAEPLVEGLAFPSRAAPDVRWRAREDLLLAKIDEARRLRHRSVTLDDRDLEILSTPGRPAPLPDAIGVMATIAASSEEAVARGDFSLLIRSAGGPSGANLLGRFCHADPELRAWVERHLREEEALAPGVVLAEVVHLPEGRVGNVLLRPVLREHEIPFLGRSGAPAARQIHPSDLVVRVVDGRAVLRSRRLDAEVSPRLTTAHGTSGPRNLGVYRFLCALQHRGRAASLGFDWGPLGNAPFLPRVVRGRLVIRRARWTVGARDLDALSRTEGAAARFRAVQAMREALGLPRWVALEDGDNELPVDLDNALAVETLAHLVQERRSARLVELFPGEGALCARGPEGAFTHEIVVPMVRRAPLPAAPPRALPAAPRRAQRLFTPGSEWLFVKLYAGAATLDRVLVEAVAPAARRALASGAADAWFFLRYADPGLHLRVRLHGDPARLHGEVLADLSRSLKGFVDADRVSRVVLDTYEREVDRYGGVEAIGVAERVFWADSEAVSDLVAGLLGTEGAADARWRIALSGIDRLLGDLGLDTSGKHVVIAAARDGLGRRFEVDTRTGRQLGERYRKERAALEPLLDAAGDAGSPLAPALSRLRRRSEQIAPFAAALRGLERAGRLSRPLSDLAGSFVHMFCNRIFRGAASEQELVVYDLLARLLASRMARGLL